MIEPFSLTWERGDTPGRVVCIEAPFAIVKRGPRFYDVQVNPHGSLGYPVKAGPQGCVFHTLQEAKNWCHRIERSHRIDTAEKAKRPSEMTPEGEQYIIPGAERRNTGSPPVQGALFDA